jgi:hypothetical protein
VHANASSVCAIAAASFKFGLVSFNGFLDGDELANVVVAILTAPSEDSRALLGLPEVEYGATIGNLEIIGVGKALAPVPAFAISHAHHPGAGSLVPPITERHARADADERRFSGNRQLEPRASSFEL